MPTTNGRLVCPTCTKPFSATRHRRHFCSRLCRQAEKQRGTLQFLRELPPGTHAAKALAAAEGIRLQSAQGRIDRLIAKGYVSASRESAPVVQLLRDAMDLVRWHDWPAKDHDAVTSLRERAAALGV